MRREFRLVGRENRVGVTANTTGVEIIGKRRVRRVSIFIHNRNIKFSAASRSHEGFKYSPSAPQFHLSTTGDSHSLRILVLIIRSESSASLSSRFQRFASSSKIKSEGKRKESIVQRQERERHGYQEGARGREKDEEDRESGKARNRLEFRGGDGARYF